MDESTPFTESEIARALGYARVKADFARPRRGQPEKRARRLRRPSIPWVGERAPRPAFA
jgi:hypothetical protein